MQLASWQSQVRKGAAELVVLNLLARAPRHGSAILDCVSGGIISEGTLYPLLARLEREGKISGRWVVEDHSRSPRKVYHVLRAGEEMLTAMNQFWHEFSQLVSASIEGELHVGLKLGSGTVPQRP